MTVLEGSGSYLLCQSWSRLLVTVLSTGFIDVKYFFLNFEHIVLIIMYFYDSWKRKEWYAYTALLFKHMCMEHSREKEKYLEHNSSGDSVIFVKYCLYFNFPLWRIFGFCLKRGFLIFCNKRKAQTLVVSRLLRIKRRGSFAFALAMACPWSECVLQVLMHGGITACSQAS